MAVEFEDAILAGLTLVREAIQSQGYQPGEAGWRVGADGTAEFSDLTIRSSDGTSSTVTVANGVITVTDAAGVPSLELDSSGVRLYEGGTVVAELAVAAGPDNDAGFIAHSRTGSGYYAMLEDGQLQLGNSNGPGDQAGPDVPASIAVGYAGTRPDYTGPTTLTVASGYMGPADFHSAALRLVSAGSGRPRALLVEEFEETECDLEVTGVLRGGSRITGTVSITPSGVDVPTSVAVTFPRRLIGTSFTCQVTANSTVPGTSVKGVSYSNLSATGVTLWLTRGNTATTTLSYTVEAAG